MEPEPTVFLCPSCKCKLTAGKTSSGLTCLDLSLLVLGLTWLRLSLLVLTCLNRRKNNKCLDLSPLWERGGCGGAQKLCGRNMESSWTIGRAASGTTILEKNKTTSTSKWIHFLSLVLFCGLFVRSHCRAGGHRRTWKSNLSSTPLNTPSCWTLSAIPVDFSTRWQKVKTLFHTQEEKKLQLSSKSKV